MTVKTFTTLPVSKVFTTVSELNKEYETMRNNILVRHGYEKGAKVKLKNAIMLYQKFDDTWLKYTSTKTDMVDRVKMFEVSKIEKEFKLVAMV